MAHIRVVNPRKGLAPETSSLERDLSFIFSIYFMAPNKFYLHEVTYLPEKRQVVAEFCSAARKFSKRYSFFPKAFLPNSKEILFYLSGQQKRKISFQKIGEKSIEVVASDLGVLQELLFSLSDEKFGEFAVPEPSRQFLLEKNWSFFDLFSIDGESIEKISLSSTSFDLEELKSRFSKDFFFIKKHSVSDAQKFLEKICLSNILAVSPSDLQKVSDKNLLLLENWFFRNGFPFVQKNPGQRLRVVSNRPMGSVEFNFSGTLNNLFCFPFQNIGPDTLNCSCCRPFSLNDKNVALDSLVRTEFLVSGFYFQPVSSSFAKEFHEKNPFKEQRLNYKKEWSLVEIPVGPFSNGQKIDLPLLEARSLAPEYARLESFSSLNWFCTLNESFVSKELNGLFRASDLLEKNCSLVQSKTIASNGLMFLQSMAGSFDYHFFSAFKNAVDGFLDAFSQTVFSSPHIFGQPVSTHFLALKQDVLSKFLEFSQKHGSVFLGRHKNSVFLRCHAPLVLAGAFSRQFGVNRPKMTT